jgi:hypothetical protein
LPRRPDVPRVPPGSELFLIPGAVLNFGYRAAEPDGKPNLPHSFLLPGREMA